jgi:hypothetical protein
MLNASHVSHFEMNMTLSTWRVKKLRENGIFHFYYFSLINNLESILKNGILPKNNVQQRGKAFRSFAEETVQDKRHLRAIKLTNGLQLSIHDLVPVYLLPRTPTLSARREMQNDFFFIEIQSDVIADENIEFAFTDGNAASKNSQVFQSLYKLKDLPWEVLNAEYWNEFNEGKRKRNAEFLIYPSIAPHWFQRIVVSNQGAFGICSRQVERLGFNLQVSIDQNFFFV